MKRSFLCTIALLFILLPYSIAAQDLLNLKFDRLTVENGLTNSIVYKMIQDENGVMWFGLHDGLDRYNGYDFKHYQPLVGMRPGSVNHQPIRSIFQQSGEEFWIGSGNNVFRYDLQSDRFELIEAISQLESINQVQGIYVSRDSICYFGTNQGLYAYNYASGTMLDFTDQTTSVISLQLIDNILWIGTGAGVRFFDPRLNEFVDPFTEAEFKQLFSSIHALSFFKHPEENYILIGTRSSGLFQLNLRRRGINRIDSEEMDFSHIRVIKPYMNNILLGMDGYGLSILDEDLNHIRNYTHNEDNELSLSSNGIYDIHIDQEERIWVSTYGGGVNVFDPNKKAFHVLRHELNNRNSLRNNVSRSFVEVDGNMIFGTAKGISIQDPSGRWRHIPSLKSDEEPKVILSLCYDSRDRIWLGTFSGGVEVRSREGRKLMNLRQEGGSGPALSTDYVFNIIEDSRNNMWIGGIRGGLMKYNPEFDRISVFNGISNVHAILETSENDIMVGTLDGVEILREINGQFRQNNSSDSLLTSMDYRVFSILETRPGIFWFGTEGSGLIRYNRHEQTITQYDTNDKLPVNIIYGILEDNNRNLWLSTTAGLSKFDLANNQVKNYNLSDGISGKNFNYGAYYKTRDGTLYFGSHEGVTYFNPDEITENTIPPEIVFTGISVFGKDADDPHSPIFNNNINETKKLEFQHNQNSFSIDYAAINYTGTRKNQYKWKLSGGDFGEGSWSLPTDQRRAVFSYLPSGQYLFQVIASNNDGIWNETGRTLEFVISPPIWGTMLAKIVYFILAILLFIGLQRYIFTYINEKQAKEKIKFFINIAHDIRTPLTLISAPMSKLIKSNKLSWEEKEEVRVAVKNTERLNTLLNQLLEFQKVSLNKQNLRVSENDIVSVVNEVLYTFQPLMDERMINVKTEVDYDTLPAWFDRQKIEKILYNLISNAIKYSHKGGAIQISIKVINSKVRISVKDDGKGIPAKQQKEIFKRYFRAQNAINTRETGSGVGLMLSKKLIELHKGKMIFTSTENVGSEFSFEFPLEKSAYDQVELLVEDVVAQKEANDIEFEEITFSQEYTILVVEDNTELRHHLRNELSKSYNILTAKNGKLAYETIIKLDVDLVISDVMMPEMDGRMLCQKIRSNIAASHIPIILLTALNSMQDKIEGLEYGADVYIEKPFDIEHLKIRIANLLKARERMKERFLDQPDQSHSQDIPNKPDQELMLKLNDLVRERVLREEFSVKEMCRLVGMSRPVLYRKLKAYTGHSPQDYIIILRLNNAARLLKEGSLSIKEIAYNSGFSDPKYFSKSFKKHYGVSPSSYIDGRITSS